MTQKIRPERVKKALELLGVKPMDNSKAREEIDRFFVGEIIPRLAQLNKTGGLPDLVTDPAWSETEQRRDIPVDSPLKPGWVVSYRGATGQIRGGTVKAGRRHGGVWAFELEDGTTLPEGQILSVARVEGGRWLAAWTVKDWGLDGTRLFVER